MVARYDDITSGIDQTESSFSGQTVADNLLRLLFTELLSKHSAHCSEFIIMLLLYVVLKSNRKSGNTSSFVRFRHISTSGFARIGCR